MAEIYTPTKKNIHASDIAILGKKLSGTPKLLGGFSIFRVISLILSIFKFWRKFRLSDFEILGKFRLSDFEFFALSDFENFKKVSA